MQKLKPISKYKIASTITTIPLVFRNTLDPVPDAAIVQVHTVTRQNWTRIKLEFTVTRQN